MHSSKPHGRIDPLDLLKSAYLKDQPPKLKNNFLYFENGIRLPISTETAWLSPITNKQYSVGSIWLHLEDKFKRIADYFTTVSELEVELVSMPDRDAMFKYFIEGKTESLCINQELKLALAQKQGKQYQSDRLEGMGQDGEKKVKVQEEMDPDLQVIDYMTKFEKPISSKNRSLRFPEKSFEGILRSLMTSQIQKNSINKVFSTVLSNIHEKKKKPIIIVPEDRHAGNVSIHNIERFLIDGEFGQKQLLESHIHKIEIEWKIKGKKVIFEVTNNPSLLGLKDWDCVVAIFIEGRKNQFSNWPVNDHIELFKRAKGFIVKYKSSRTEEVDLNVRTVFLEKNIRYRDHDMQMQIWEEIQSQLMSKLSK